MSGTFNPYHRWLGIPPKAQPPTCYRLLGLEPFEADADVIRDAAEQRMAHVRTYQLGQYSELSQRILNELAAAKACLLDAARKAAYDQQLQTAQITLPLAEDVSRLKKRSWIVPATIVLLAGLTAVVCYCWNQRGKGIAQGIEKSGSPAMSIQGAASPSSVRSPGVGRPSPPLSSGGEIASGREERTARTEVEEQSREKAKPQAAGIEGRMRRSDAVRRPATSRDGRGGSVPNGDGRSWK